MLQWVMIRIHQKIGSIHLMSDKALMMIKNTPCTLKTQQKSNNWSKKSSHKSKESESKKKKSIFAKVSIPRWINKSSLSQLKTTIYLYTKDKLTTSIISNNILQDKNLTLLDRKIKDLENCNQSLRSKDFNIQT